MDERTPFCRIHIVVVAQRQTRHTGNARDRWVKMRRWLDKNLKKLSRKTVKYQLSIDEVKSPETVRKVKET